LMCAQTPHERLPDRRRTRPGPVHRSRLPRKVLGLFRRAPGPAPDGSARSEGMAVTTSRSTSSLADVDGWQVRRPRLWRVVAGGAGRAAAGGPPLGLPPPRTV